MFIKCFIIAFHFISFHFISDVSEIIAITSNDVNDKATRPCHLLTSSYPFAPHPGGKRFSTVENIFRFFTCGRNMLHKRNSNRQEFKQQTNQMVQKLFYMCALTDGRMKGRTDGRMDERTDGRKDGRTNGRTDGRTKGRTDGRKKGRKVGWKDGQSDTPSFRDAMKILKRLALIDEARRWCKELRGSQCNG